MSTYAIGDIQGCHGEFLSLLDMINFDENRDRLWLCGDLVNRGPQSLNTLRFVKALGDAALCVLGNHDLHLLAIAHGQEKYKHKDDTIDDILCAEDREELLSWLRRCPLIHSDSELGYTMVHAGLAPTWSVQQACELALEVESVIGGEAYYEFFAHMYGNQPDKWSEELRDWDRIRVITNYLTRLRFCEENGRMDFSIKKSPGNQPDNFFPWFELAERRSKDNKILFGHWAALRNYKIDYQNYNVYPLDTGCLWGGSLSAFRLEDETWFAVPSQQIRH